MAENKTINIKINSNTKEATKDTKDYNKAIGSTKKQYDAVLKSGDSYEKQLSDINKIVKETPLNVRDMNKQIQAYQSIALSAGRETPVGKEALQKASELRDRYIDIQNETKRLADDQKNLQGAIQLVGTGVAAFGGVQSAMALTGVESEKLRETMVKVMAAQTLLNSINQIATALEKESSAMLLLKTARTKALTVAQTVYTAVTGKATAASKLFKIALASTGIGLIVVAVGALIANFDKLLVPLNAAKNALKAFGDAIGLTNFKQKEAKQAVIDRSLAEKKASIQRLKDIDKEIESIDRHAEAEKRLTSVKLRQIALDQAKAKSTQEVVDLEKEATEAKIALNEKEYNDFVEKQKLTLEKHEEEARLLQGVIDRNIAKGRSDHTNEVKLLKERRDIIKKLNNDILNNNFDFYTENQVAREEIEAEGQRKVDSIRNTAQDKWKAYAQERLSIARKIEDIENSLLTDGIEKELEINEDKFKRLREDAKKNTKLTRKERARLIELFDEQELAQQKVINQKYIDLEKEKNKKIDEEKAKANQERIDKEDALFQLELDLMKDRQMAEIIALSQSYEAKYLLAQDNAELTKQLEEQFLIDQAAIEDKFRKEKADKEKAASDKSIAEAQAEADAKLAIQNAQMANIEAGISLLKDVAGENNKLQALAIAAENAVGIAKIIISTQAANAAAKLKYAAIPGGLALAAAEITANKVSAGIGIAASVAAAAKGIASLKASASLDSGGSLGGGGAGTEAAAPQFNVVGDSGINQIAQLQQQPVQAFVVSGEVTTSQALDRNRVQNATL